MSQLRSMLKLAKGYVKQAKRAKALGFPDAYHLALDMASGVIAKIEFELDVETRRQESILEQYIKPEAEEVDKQET